MTRAPALRRFAAAAQAALKPQEAAARDPATFHARDLVVETAERLRPKPRLQDLAFGKTFTDHMLVCEHDARLGGWAPPRIVPFDPRAPLLAPPLPGASSPALQALHYGGSCFEGMKAYPCPDGPRLFRPELNAARLARSAGRLGLASWAPGEFLGCLGALLEKDAAWMPPAGAPSGHAMYVRPFAYASEDALGVHRTSSTAVAVVLSPVGPYFRTGSAAVSLLLDERRVRAWPGGTGRYKIAGNYAPTVVPQSEAAGAHGCAQVLYSMPAAALLRPCAGGGGGEAASAAGGSGSGNGGNGGSGGGNGGLAGSGLELPAGLELSDRVVGECGAMNVFFVLETDEGGGALELVTPPLDDGTILPGITRQSALELARGWASDDEQGGQGAAAAAIATGGGKGDERRRPLIVRERHVTVRELREASARGRLREVFGTGTACVVQPVAELVLEGGGGGGPVRLSAPGSSGAAAAAAAPGSSGPLWARLGAALADIQYGRVPGHPWSVRAADLARAAGL